MDFLIVGMVILVFVLIIKDLGKLLAGIVAVMLPMIIIFRVTDTICSYLFGLWDSFKNITSPAFARCILLVIVILIVFIVKKIRKALA